MNAVIKNRDKIYHKYTLYHIKINFAYGSQIQAHILEFMPQSHEKFECK